MSDELQPSDFFERLNEVENELASRRGARGKAWRYLTTRVPVIAAVIYLYTESKLLLSLDDFYLGVGLVFVAAVADLLYARRREQKLLAERDELLVELEGRVGD